MLDIHEKLFNRAKGIKQETLRKHFIRKTRLSLHAIWDKFEILPFLTFCNPLHCWPITIPWIQFFTPCKFSSLYAWDPELLNRKSRISISSSFWPLRCALGGGLYLQKLPGGVFVFLFFINNSPFWFLYCTGNFYRGIWFNESQFPMKPPYSLQLYWYFENNGL